MSSFNGRIREYRGISVDRFDGDNVKSTLFFLSHVHYDHTVGLESILARIKCGEARFYASELTKKLLRNCRSYCELADYVTELPLDTPTLLPLDPQIARASVQKSVYTDNTSSNGDSDSNGNANLTVSDEAQEGYVTVTLLAAGHCLGSCMFLFEGEHGAVLYTGDFRIPIGGARRMRALHQASGKLKQLQTVYVDSTYFLPELSISSAIAESEPAKIRGTASYDVKQQLSDIPSRDEATRLIVAECERWLARGSRYVVRLKTRSRYSYEHMFEALFNRFRMRIHVHATKYAQYTGLPHVQRMLTLDANESRIHDCQDYTTGAIFGHTMLYCDADVVRAFHESNRDAEAQLGGGSRRHCEVDKSATSTAASDELTRVAYESSRDAPLEKHALPCAHRPANWNNEQTKSTLCKSCHAVSHRCAQAHSNGNNADADRRLEVLTIIPSSLWFYLEARCRTFFERVDSHTIRVLYSMHASYGELRDFLGYLRPQEVVACVVPFGHTMESISRDLALVVRTAPNETGNKQVTTDTDALDNLDARSESASQKPKSTNGSTLKRQLFEAACSKSSSSSTSSTIANSKRLYKRLRHDSNSLDTFSDLE